MAPEKRARVKPPERQKRGSPPTPVGAQRKLSADTPRFRASGDGLVGIKLRPRGKLTTARMTRILRAMALTPSQHGAWTGYTLDEYIKANPTWTERKWFEIVQENYATVQAAAVAA